MEKVSKSHEDYLEAIVMLGGSPDTPIRSVDVANKLGVSKASVNKAVALLKEKKMLDQPYYGDITLTQDGYEYGAAVYKRHRYLSAFLEKKLGIDAETAAEEACMMEHAISDEAFEKWIDYIDGLGVIEPDEK